MRSSIHSRMIKPVAMDQVATLEQVLDQLVLDTARRSPEHKDGASWLAQSPEHKDAASWLMRNSVQKEEFQATREWQLLPENVICPAGLQFKVDLNSNTTLARLHPSPNTSESTASPEKGLKI